VADMDFPPAPPVREAIADVMARGQLGYPWLLEHDPVAHGFADWAARRYGWQVDPGLVVSTIDVLQPLQALIELSSEVGDGIVLQTPIYPPFHTAVTGVGRRIVENRLGPAADGWPMDLAGLAAGTDASTKVVVLCNPHNPTGRVFSRDELAGLAALAVERDWLVISDEIHADLTYAPRRHRPMALFAPDRTVTIHAASKAFNLAGLRYAVMHIGPAALREQILGVPDHLYGEANMFGAEAARVAWTQGDEWLDAVLAHLDRMRMLAGELLAEHLPQVVYTPPAATYLGWLDCRALGFGDDPSREFAARGVQLNEGPEFGDLGVGHTRLNFATSSHVLRAIVQAMATPPAR